MTVTRRVEASFDAPDDETADWLAGLLCRVLMGGNWPTWDDMNRAHGGDEDKWGPPLGFPITGQAFASEPVVPSPEPLVEPG